MSILTTKCECGHEKRDHALPLIGNMGYGECKVCLCNRYAKVQAGKVAAKASAVSQP